MRMRFIRISEGFSMPVRRDGSAEAFASGCWRSSRAIGDCERRHRVIESHGRQIVRLGDATVSAAPTRKRRPKAALSFGPVTVHFPPVPLPAAASNARTWFMALAVAC
jgi:hypothetical protein